MKYVALLALNRIVTTHPMLVSVQQDVIMECLDDPDISIRLQALELAAGMVTNDSLQEVVNRLVQQLRFTPLSAGVNPNTDPDEESETPIPETKPLPNDYRTEVIHRIIDICSQNNYSELEDFEWYVNILVQLIRLLPLSETEDYYFNQPPVQDSSFTRTTVAFRIGSEIRNIAVRVKGVRLEACQAAESLLLIDNRPLLFPVGSSVGDDVLGPVSWVVGEYAEYLRSPARALQSLIDSSHISLPTKTLQLFLQAIPKVFIQASKDAESRESWKSEISLLLARVVEFLDSLADHPDLDVQERAIEFLEVLRLGNDALRSDTKMNEVPFFITSVIPSLFEGLELKPVSNNAQKKVVLSENLKLDEPFNDDLPSLFRNITSVPDQDYHVALQDFYYVKESSLPMNKLHDLAQGGYGQLDSYQNTLGGGGTNTNTASYQLSLAGQKAERRERYRDDPFYIAGAGAGSGSGTSTPSRDVIPSDGFDIDNIPIVDLKLDDGLKGPARDSETRRQARRMEVAGDETLGVEDVPGPVGVTSSNRRGLLQVDSSTLGQPSLGGGAGSAAGADDGDKEMKEAMQNVEKVRLRMQRDSERIGLEGTPDEGTLVKKKKKSKKDSTKTKTGDEDKDKKKRRKKKSEGQILE